MTLAHEFRLLLALARPCDTHFAFFSFLPGLITDFGYHYGHGLDSISGYVPENCLVIQFVIFYKYQTLHHNSTATCSFVPEYQHRQLHFAMRASCNAT